MSEYLPAPGQIMEPIRKINPEDIALPPGYRIEVYATGLTTPINLHFADDGTALIADAGITDGNGKVYRQTATGWELIADGFNPPLTGVNTYGDLIYVSHRGFITAVDRDGNKTDILAGLPSWGDHHNNRVIFGADGKMYFGQGTATNSGVVGMDNAGWVVDHPEVHDLPGTTVTLVGQNYLTENFLTAAVNDTSLTGAYSPFGVTTQPGEEVKGRVTASGSVLRANPDGSQLETVAWGLRNPFRMRFDCEGRLWSANHGMDVRGSRPVDNSPDEFQLIQLGAWYGWPDYTGGLPVTLPQFRAPGYAQPTFLLAVHPMVPPKPFALFPDHSATMGFDFNYSAAFGTVGDAYIAEFGSEAPETTGGLPAPLVGHRVSTIDMCTGAVQTFAINKTGLAASATDGGGLERPIDAVFGPDGALYVVDFGLALEEEDYLPGTGVIWRITKG